MISYDEWYVPTSEDLKFEHETEWDKMRLFLNTAFFDDETRMVDLIERYGKPRLLTKSMDHQVSRRTRAESIEEVEYLVSGYRSAERRKGVPTRLAEMFRRGEPLPMPIIMRRNHKDFIIGGNTRLNVAEILDVHPDPQILYVDLDQPAIKQLLDKYPLDRLRGM